MRMTWLFASDAGALPAVTLGVVRGGSVVVELQRPMPRGWKLGLAATCLDGEGEREAQLGPIESGKRRNCFVADLPGRDVPDGPLLKRVTPFATSRSGGVERLRTDGGYELHTLLPMNEDELGTAIFDKRSRHKDVQTLEFLLDQVMRSPGSGAMEKVEAAKIASYRAMERADAERLAISVAHVGQALRQAALIEAEFGIGKASRYHATLSLWFVKAYLHLFRGEIGACEDMLERVRSSLGDVEKCPMVANNSALGLTVLGYIHLCKGDHERAVAIWKEVILLFRRAAQTYPAKKPKLFEELQVPFEAAKFCSVAVAATRRGEPGRHPQLSSEHVARTFLRLRGPNASKGLARAVDVLEGLRREARAPSAQPTGEPDAHAGSDVRPDPQRIT